MPESHETDLPSGMNPVWAEVRKMSRSIPKGSFFGESYGQREGYLPEPRAIDPAELLKAVEKMHDAQRCRLAQLLGFEVPHPFLSLPSARGGFTMPTVRAAEGIPPGFAVMRGHQVDQLWIDDVWIDLRPAQETAPEEHRLSGEV